MKIVWVFFVAIFFSNYAWSAEIKSSRASYDNKTFYIHISAFIDANPNQVMAILTDYNHLGKLNPQIIESEILIPKDKENKTTVRTVIKGCVWFFCHNIINVQEVTTSDLSIVANTLPKQSNIKFGKMRWQIKPTKNGSEIHYFAAIKPAFFVPPVIGSVFVRDSLLQESIALIKNLESLARVSQVKAQ